MEHLVGLLDSVIKASGDWTILIIFLVCDCVTEYCGMNQIFQGNFREWMLQKFLKNLGNFR